MCIVLKKIGSNYFTRKRLIKIKFVIKGHKVNEISWPRLYTIILLYNTLFQRNRRLNSSCHTNHRHYNQSQLFYSAAVNDRRMQDWAAYGIRMALTKVVFIYAMINERITMKFTSENRVTDELIKKKLYSNQYC